MVATGIRLPNIRRMFAPDTYYTICDADLAGADAQVVAWEADDEALKQAFRSKVKIHIFNARTLWPGKTASMDDKEIEASPLYYQAKRGVHATNYVGTPNSLVTNLGWSYKFAEDFQARWFAAHPSIKSWHERIERYLDGTQCWNCDNQDITLGKPCNQCGKSLGMTIKNKFGFQRIYTERIEGLLPKAVAWGPQSTIAICTELGWTTIDRGPEFELQLGHGKIFKFDARPFLVEPRSYEKWHRLVEFLLQVHDSVVFQVPSTHETFVPEIVHDMQVIIPYEDPLIIPMGYKTSRVSWGECG